MAKAVPLLQSWGPFRGTAIDCCMINVLLDLMFRVGQDGILVTGLARPTASRPQVANLPHNASCGASGAFLGSHDAGGDQENESEGRRNHQARHRPRRGVRQAQHVIQKRDGVG